MEFKTMKSSSPKAGQAVVEWAIGTLVLFPTILLISTLVAQIVMGSLLDIDTYHLARNHLYGLKQSDCRAARWWPSQGPLRLELRCSGNGDVQGELKWNTLILAQSHFDLRMSKDAP